MTILITAALLAIAHVPGCEQRPAARAGKDSTGTTPAAAGPAFVLLKTSRGDIALELDMAKSPITVENFLGYVRGGFYNGTMFHQCTPGFIVQAGGFDGKLVQKPTQAPIKNEWENGLKNVRGSVSMARSTAADSATSQFFVNLADNGTLDGADGQAGSAVFGWVVRGMDVIDAIAATPTGDKSVTDLRGNAVVLRGVPVEMVTILSAAQVSEPEARGPVRPTTKLQSPGGGFSIEP